MCIRDSGAGYHLGLVSRYLREHGFVRITDNLYAAMPGGVEMLFLFAFAFGKHSAAALVHLAFLLALVWQIFSYARRRGFPVVGQARRSWSSLARWPASTAPAPITTWPWRRSPSRFSTCSKSGTKRATHDYWPPSGWSRDSPSRRNIPPGRPWR